MKSFMRVTTQVSFSNKLKLKLKLPNSDVYGTIILGLYIPEANSYHFVIIHIYIIPKFTLNCGWMLHVGDVI